MRDKNLTVRNFLFQLEELSKGYSQLMRNTLRTPVIDNPNFLDDFYTDLVLPKTLEDNYSLSILLWFVEDKEIFWYLFLSLEKQTARYPELGLVLDSKYTMLLFLLETKRWHSRDFFGNLYSKKNMKRIITSLEFKRKPSHVSKPQRKRGYDDKGTLVLSHKWVPKDDYSLTEKQKEIEQKRLTSLDTIELLLGFLE